MTRQSGMKIGGLFPIEPALRRITAIIRKKCVQAPRIDVLPIKCQDHRGGTNSAAGFSHRRCGRSQLVITPARICLRKSLDRNNEARKEIEATAGRNRSCANIIVPPGKNHQHARHTHENKDAKSSAPNRSRREAFARLCPDALARLHLLFGGPETRGAQHLTNQSTSWSVQSPK